MDQEDAKRIAADHLACYREKNHAELAAMVGGDTVVLDLRDNNGEEYQIEVLVCWDGRKGQDVRVMVDVLEVPLRPLFWKIPVLRWLPIFGGSMGSDSFIMSPSGEFVGESRREA